VGVNVGKEFGATVASARSDPDSLRSLRRSHPNAPRLAGAAVVRADRRVGASETTSAKVGMVGSKDAGALAKAEVRDTSGSGSPDGAWAPSTSYCACSVYWGC